VDSVKWFRQAVFWTVFVWFSVMQGTQPGVPASTPTPVQDENHKENNG
jgi:hypothetical protein